MSYYRYKKSDRSTSRIFHSNNPNDKRPRRKLDVRNYLKDEFFSCNDIVFARIADLYCALYGANAHNYMMKTFYGWKSGRVSMSGQTFSRILECVPKFLSDEKRFYILKCEIILFLETIHYNQQGKKNNKVSIAEINSLFENYLTEINNFDKGHLSWFLGKGIFTEVELEQFLLACQYSLRKKLNLAYRQVYNDLLLIKHKLANHKMGTFDGSYKIDFIDSTVEIKNINAVPLPMLEFENRDFKIEGNFKQYAERYIIEELMALNFSERVGESKALIKSNDIDIIFSHFNGLKKQNSEVEIKSSFEGEGGLLNINLSFTPTKKIIQNITLSVINILAFFGCIGGMITYGIGKNHEWALWIGFYVGLYLLSLIFKELVKVIDAAKKWNHGK
jgi:hypothetical protein